MEKTKKKADELTSAGSGKHHIGDFLPPKELEKFLAKVRYTSFYSKNKNQEIKHVFVCLV